MVVAICSGMGAISSNFMASTDFSLLTNANTWNLVIGYLPSVDKLWPYLVKQGWDNISMQYYNLAVGPDRWEVGTWSTLHIASNTLLYAYITLPFGMLQVHFLVVWALEHHLPKLVQTKATLVKVWLKLKVLHFKCPSWRHGGVCKSW